VSGASATGTVVLSGNAPAGGFSIALKSNVKFAQVSTPFVVPAGKNSETFPITTSYVYPGATATISATNISTHSATLAVTPGNALSNGSWPKAYANNQNTSSSNAPNAKGKLKWSVDFYGGRYTPAAYGKGEIATVEFAPAPRLLIFDITGKLLYKSQMAATQASAPAVGSDGSFYVMTDQGLSAFRTNGAAKFTLPIANAIPQIPIVSPTGTIFVASTDKLYAVNASGTVKWSLAGHQQSQAGPTGSIYAISSDGIALISSTGAVKWDHPFPRGSVGAAVGPDGGLFVNVNDKVAQGVQVGIQALNLDGSTKYQWPTSGVLTASTVGSDGVLYSVETNADTGTATLLALSPTGTSLWQHALATSVPIEWFPAGISFRPDRTLLVSYANNVLNYTTAGVRNWIVTLPHNYISAPALAEDSSAYLVSLRDGYDHPNLFEFLPESDRLKSFSVVRVTPAGKRDWTFYGGGPSAAPAVGADGTLYAPLCSGILQTLHPDGAFGWAYLAGSPIENTPTLGADGTVYFATQDGTVYALTSSGAKKWSYSTGGFIYGGIALSNDPALYVVSDTGLTALDLSGHLKWTVKGSSDHIGSSSPALAADGTVYFSAGALGLKAVKPDGTVKWTSGPHIFATPIVLSGGNIFFSGGAQYKPDGTWLWDFAGSGPPDVISSLFNGHILLWLNGAVGYGFDSDNSQLWANAPGNGGFIAQGSVSGSGMLYVPGSAMEPGKVLSGGQMYAVDITSGKLAWTLPAIQGDAFTTSIGADGTIYLVTAQGLLIAVG